MQHWTEMSIIGLLEKIKISKRFMNYFILFSKDISGLI